MNEEIKCLRCGRIDDYVVTRAGPHLKATCNGCGYYIKFIKQNNTKNMAADKIINIRINVKKINKQWLYEGEKGTYLDAVVWFNEEQDEYESNGMITQSVPQNIRERESKVPKEKKTRGEILGNCRVFEKSEGASESVPGKGSKKEKEKAAAAKSTSKKKKVEEEEEDEDAEEVVDDLPF